MEERDELKPEPMWRTQGGVELLPVRGHLGSREPIVKPTLSGRFFFTEGGDSLVTI